MSGVGNVTSAPAPHTPRTLGASVVAVETGFGDEQANLALFHGIIINRGKLESPPCPSGSAWLTAKLNGAPWQNAA